MQRLSIIMFVLVALFTTSMMTAQTVDRPANRVLAIYFHRTQRCPTCLKMGEYTEEAIRKSFEKQLKQGTVELHFVDFQDEKNARLSKAYQITSPNLILVKVVDNKVKEHKNLKDIWTKVQKKPEFVEYIRENVEAYTQKSNGGRA